MSQLPECRFKENLNVLLSQEWGRAESIHKAEELSGDQLIKKARLSEWRAEGNNSWPSPPQLLRLAHRLGVTTDYLLTGEQPNIDHQFPAHIAEMVKTAQRAGPATVEQAIDYLKYLIDQEQSQAQESEQSKVSRKTG